MTQKKVKFTREYLEFHVNLGYMYAITKDYSFLQVFSKKFICEPFVMIVGNLQRLGWKFT